MTSYDKVTRYFRLQQQKQHYRRIVFAKKNIDFLQFEQNTLTCVRPNHKYETAREREVKQSNLKLYNRLLQIRNKKGILQQYEESSKRKQSKLDSFITINHSLEQKINRENIKLVSRLSEVKPVVGNRKQWKKQFKKSRSIKKQIHRYVKNETIDPSLYIRQTLTALSQRKTKGRKIHTSLAETNHIPVQNEQKSDVEEKIHQPERKKKKTSRKVNENMEKMNETKVPIKQIILNNVADQRWTTSSNKDIQNKES